MSVRIGLLTAGGDCPGLNAVIRAIVRRASTDGANILGIRNGWLGLIEDDVVELTRSAVAGILPRGGTILGTSRFNPLQDDQSITTVKNNWKRFGLGALIVVGGEGTLSAARDVWQQHGLQIVGIPKTIDNDVWGTDFTFGFDTAVSVVTDAIDRLHSTAESHHRVMEVEVMGRHTGWIAAYGGIAEDAHPHPDEPFLSTEMAGLIYRHDRLGGIGEALAAEIERCTKIQTRV